MIQWQQHAVQSPLVLPDNRVTFRLMAPDASSVSVHNTTGGYADWPDGNDVPLTRDPQGLWSATIGPLRAELSALGKPLAPLDLMIAAHALAEGATLITVDRAFTQVPGLDVEGYEQP